MIYTVALNPALDRYIVVERLLMEDTITTTEKGCRMFRHILCPTDLKERAFIALKKAVQIAHQFNSKITILNVHPEFMGQQDREMLRVSFDGLKEKYRRVALESREEMKAEISKLHAEAIQVDYVTRAGHLV